MSAQKVQNKTPCQAERVKLGRALAPDQVSEISSDYPQLMHVCPEALKISAGPSLAKHPGGQVYAAAI